MWQHKATAKTGASMSDIESKKDRVVVQSFYLVNEIDNLLASLWQPDVDGYRELVDCLIEAREAAIDLRHMISKKTGASND